jgi:hypothetical protein
MSYNHIFDLPRGRAAADEVSVPRSAPQVKFFGVMMNSLDYRCLITIFWIWGTPYNHITNQEIGGTGAHY